MELKIGDKVRYLDAVGGGVITAFKGKDQVLVLEEDGFETPVLRRQCVVVEHEPSSEIRKKEPPVEKPSQIKHSATIKKSPPTREGEIIQVFLAYLPEEARSFNEAAIECYLINDSNYTLLFNYASASGKTWKSRQSGELEPNEKLFLESFARETLTEMEKVSLQCLAFKKDTHYTWQNAFSVELRLETVKFYKIHCFRENDYFDEDALLYPVIRNGIPVKELLIDSEDLARAMQEKEPVDRKAEHPFRTTSKNDRQLIEIDLHTSSLLDTTAGMSPSDLLNYQLDVFRKTMEAYKNEKGRQIVFIHGKGDGVLRAAILKEIAGRYKSCTCQDASFREYGFGATQVTIR